MENMHLEPITKEILEMLAKYTFTPERNFGIYDNISISGDGEYIEFYGEIVDKEPVYDKHGELMDYNYSVKSMERRYRRDKFSGEYFEY